MKPDERSLLLALAEADIVGGRSKDVFPRDLAVRLGIPAKRACYLFQKWTDKGWYNYGVGVDMGWLEGKGCEVAAGATGGRGRRTAAVISATPTVTGRHRPSPADAGRREDTIEYNRMAPNDRMNRMNTPKVNPPATRGAAESGQENRTHEPRLLRPRPGRRACQIQNEPRSGLSRAA